MAEKLNGVKARYLTLTIEVTLISIKKQTHNCAKKSFIKERETNSDLLFSQKILRIVITFCLITFSWLFFRAGSMENAICVLKNILHIGNVKIFWDGSLASLAGGKNTLHVLLIAILILFIVDYFKYKEMDMVIFVLTQQFWFRYLVCAVLFFTILIFGHYGEGYDAQQFIYFQF